MLEEGREALPSAQLVNRCCQRNRCDVVRVAERIKERHSAGIAPGSVWAENKLLKLAVEVFGDCLHCDAEQNLPVVKPGLQPHFPQPALLRVAGVPGLLLGLQLPCKLLGFQSFEVLQSCKQPANGLRDLRTRRMPLAAPLLQALIVFSAPVMGLSVAADDHAPK